MKIDATYIQSLPWHTVDGEFDFYAVACVGMLLEITVDGTSTYHLIGNVNELGGVCDDCVLNIPDNSRIRYAQLIELDISKA